MQKASFFLSLWKNLQNTHTLPFLEEERSENKDEKPKDKIKDESVKHESKEETNMKILNLVKDAIEHQEWTLQYVKSTRERRWKNQSPSLNIDGNCAATSENFLTKAASATNLKSQHNIQNIFIDDKYSNVN